jgi:hypothetical protein
MQEKHDVEEYKEKEKTWLEKEEEYIRKIKSYRSRLDVDLSLDQSSSNNNTDSSQSVATPGSPKARRMAYKLDALERHVLKLRELLQKADADHDQLSEALADKTRQLR